MASANKATVLEQLQTTATKIKQYILQQISDLSDAVMAAIPDTYAGSASAGGPADKAVSIPMGQLDSTSTATVMTAQVDGITELRNGVCVWLKNGVVTSASGVTLNINGLGAKPLYSSLAAASRSTTIFNINYTLLLVYNATRVDGGCWDVVYGIDSNTTYSPASLGFGYGVCSTAAATAAKAVAVSSYKLGVGGYVTVKFDNDVPANATLNVNTRGAKAIYHKGAAITAGVIKAGDIVTFCYSTYYHVVAIIRDGGIPKSDLASAVQTSLEKADTALQEHQTLKTINGNSLVGSGNISIPALPAVTSADNGNVMTVVDGAWAVDSPFIGEITHHTESSGGVTTYWFSGQEIRDLKAKTSSSKRNIIALRILDSPNVFLIASAPSAGSSGNTFFALENNGAFAKLFDCTAASSLKYRTSTYTYSSSEDRFKYVVSGGGGN